VKALVTGATGFLGSRLVRRLIADGHTVSVLSRGTSSYAQIQDLLAQLTIYTVDEHPDGFRRAVAAAAPDVVFHLATYYARDHRPDDLAALLEANIAFPLRLIDAMAREGARCLVNTGSAWQFYESATYRPVCLHSATKEAFSALVRYFVDIGAIDCITLMMHDSYGPGDPRRKIFTILSDRAGTSEPLQMSAGEQWIDLIHVNDAVGAYLVAADRLRESRRPAAHETYSIGGGNPLPLRQVVETFLRHAGMSIPIQWGGRPYHEREVMQTWAGGERLPNWWPRIDIDTGLKELALGFAQPHTAVGQVSGIRPASGE
jgi:nucleoside-diphosphate-sugar epimerase